MSRVCSIALNDGATLVHIGHDAPARRLNFMICIDEVEPTGGQLFDLLAANFDGVMTGGGHFSIEASTGALILQRHVAADALQGNAIMDVLDALVSAAEYWAKKLSDEANADRPTSTGLSGQNPGMELRV